MEAFQRAYEVLTTSFCTIRKFEVRDTVLSRTVGEEYALGLVRAVTVTDEGGRSGLIALIPSNNKVIKTREMRPEQLIPTYRDHDFLILVVESEQMRDKVRARFPPGSTDVYLMYAFLDHNVTTNVYVNEHARASPAEVPDGAADLPKILSDDPQVVWRGFRVGDIVRISRPGGFAYRQVVGRRVGG